MKLQHCVRILLETPDIFWTWASAVTSVNMLRRWLRWVWLGRKLHVELQGNTSLDSDLKTNTWKRCLWRSWLVGQLDYIYLRINRPGVYCKGLLGVSVICLVFEDSLNCFFAVVNLVALFTNFRFTVGIFQEGLVWTSQCAQTICLTVYVKWQRAYWNMEWRHSARP